MNNFPIEYEGKTYWYSRSTVVGMFAFCKNSLNEWCILANKRGNGCPSGVGRWNVPGGYMDFDENICDAAIRECKEETGVHLDKNLAKVYSVKTYPYKSAQNISYKFYMKVPGKTSDWSKQFTTEFMEADEVTEIKWIPVKELDKYQWAFNHENIIKDVYTHVINPTFKQMLKNKLADLLGFTYLYEFT